MKHIFLLLVLRSLVGFCDFHPESTDKGILQGKLENGLTYYIRENSFPKEKASLQLAVKVGSVYETEKERGIAHFMEHLVFRGTEGFKDGAIFGYLESIGAWSGSHTNAMTSFESTVFQFEIPIEKEGALETTLAILSDLGGFATLDAEAIDKERNVVLDELYQSYSSPHKRVGMELLVKGLPGSLLAERLPIGLEKVIKEITPEELRAFYKKWYRPDRMALIAVGDFNQQEVLEKVKNAFSRLVLPKETVQEPDLRLVFQKDLKSIVHFDPDLDHTAAIFTSFYLPKIKDLTPEEAVQQEFLSSIVNSLLSERLYKKTEEGALLLEASVHELPFGQQLEQTFGSAILFEDNIEEGIRAFNQEIQRAFTYGFSQKEWEGLRQQFKIGFEKQLLNADRYDHKTYATKALNHFLKGDPILSEEWILGLMMDCLSTWSVADVNAYLPKSSLKDPTLVLLTTPSEKVRNEFTDERVTALFKEGCLVGDLQETEMKNLVMEPRFPKGEITAAKDEINSGIRRLTLSNGIQVILKPSVLERNQIQILAEAKGGLASIAKEELPSASFSTYGFSSGIQGLTPNELNKFLQGKGISWRSNLTEGTRYLHTKAGKEEIETAFQLLHERFTSPNFDHEIWEREITKAKEVQKQQLKDPTYLFGSFVKGTNSQNYYFFQPVNIDEAKEEAAQKAYDHFFGNPQDFLFVIVGDFDFDEMAPLVEKYVASLPVKEKKEAKDFSLPKLFPDKIVKENYVDGHNSFSTTVVSLPFDMQQGREHHQNSQVFDGVAKILSQRLWAVLRLELGGTYGVQAGVSTPFAPNDDHAMLQIFLTSQPERQEVMVARIMEEIEKLKMMPPTEEEVKTLRALFLEKKKEQSLSNSFWLEMISRSEFKKLPLEQMMSYMEEINALTPATLHQAAKAMFESPTYTVLSHLPVEKWVSRSAED